MLTDVLEKSQRRHGSINSFHRIAAWDITIRHLSGLIPWMKGLGRTFPHPTSVRVQPHVRRAVFQQFNPDRQDVIYDNGSVIVGQRVIDHYRKRFAGLRKYRRWSTEDAAYFFGYAICDYLGFPFTLAGHKVTRSKVFRDGSSRITIQFPEDCDTHSRVQHFFFDHTGLLVRHDYRADILGPMFFGAHHHREYRLDTPIPFAQQRVVTARIGSWSLPVIVLQAELVIERFELLA